MTFLEAAIEVLRQENGPLEISQITQRAVAQRLLSHVGRDPEAAMRTCLDSAARDPSAAGILEKDGTRGFRIRAGLKIPEPKLEVRPSLIPRLDAPDVEVEEPVVKKTNDTKRKGRGLKANSDENSEDSVAKQNGNSPGEGDGESLTEAPETSGRRPSSKGRSTSRRKPTVSKRKVEDSGSEIESPSPDESAESMTEQQRSLQFAAPTGAGLDGVTDVALVMANAMSRLAGTRPELRHELEAMQQRERTDDSTEDGSEAIESTQDQNQDGVRPRGDGENDERPGRRRRRRRKKTRRGDEIVASGSLGKSGTLLSEELLDRIAVVLGDAGPKAVHIRQISETLAAQGLLEGDVSELERTLTAAMVVDNQRKGLASRFCIRGDSRYQLRDTRLPQSLAQAEDEFRRSLQNLEHQNHAQLIRWIEQLGIRGFEALVRIYCENEGLQIRSMPASGRGMVRMIVESVIAPESGDGPTLILVLPRKIQFDLRSVGAELERYSCTGAIIFSANSPIHPAGEDEVRIISAARLAKYLVEKGVVVNEVNFCVPVVNPSFIEAIGGLDS